MKINAQPADLRASETFGTVKKRMMTCGRPAVPTISAIVMQKMSNMAFEPEVYSLKPKSVSTPFSLSSMAIGSPCTLLMKPSCGTGLPVINIDTKIAGVR